MSLAAPGSGSPRAVLSAGLLLNSAVYLVAGVMFQVYTKKDPMYDVLSMAWTFLQVAQGGLLVYPAYCFVKQRGKIQSWPSTEAAGTVLAACTAAMSLLWLVFALKLPTWSLSLVSTVVATFTMLALVLLGCMGDVAPWSWGALLAFGIAGVFQFAPVAVFWSSQSFNSNGLAHNEMVLYYVALFGLLCQLPTDNFARLAGGAPYHGEPPAAAAALVVSGAAGRGVVVAGTP